MSSSHLLYYCREFSDTEELTESCFGTYQMMKSP